MNTEDDDATEPIQVVNYGTGGHYEPHVDYFGPMVDAYQGDRVATMLYYLSDDIVGGKYAAPSLLPGTKKKIFTPTLLNNKECQKSAIDQKRSVLMTILVFCQLPRHGKHPT